MLPKILTYVVAFACGAALTDMVPHWTHRPIARIYTNTDLGTPLNHGQKSIQITLPNEKFVSFGGCYPNWTSLNNTIMYWSEITCEVERFNPKTLGYEPSRFPGVWSQGGSK